MWDIFQAGGPVMWPLLLCSILSLTIILERAWFWARLNLDADTAAIEAFLETCAAHSAHGPHGAQDGESPLRGKPGGIVLTMLVSGMAHAGFSSAKAMEAVALEAVKSMRRGMPVLDTIITIAPMLGILGTVTGIIASFDMLGQTGVEDPKAVVAGIAEALITTAAGLGISVATVFPYNYFNSRIEDAQDTFEYYGTRLEIALPQHVATTGRAG